MKKCMTLGASLLGSLFIMVGFQNCSDTMMQFSEIPEKDLFTYGEAPEYICQRYEEISLDDVKKDLWEIPARSADGTCLYVKIANQLPVQASASSGLAQDSEVVASDHGKTSTAENYYTANPYIMASEKIQFRLADRRNLLLVGGLGENKTLLVDNFVLVGVTPVGYVQDISKNYLAYGTADSSAFRDKSKVIVRESLVDVIRFASGGTSVVEPVPLQNKLAVGYNFFLDIRALDCGGSAHLSEIYLVIQ